MALLETVALTLGTAVAKQMIKVWLGDSIQTSAIEALFSLTETKLSEFFNQRPTNENSIDQIAIQVVEQMKPFFNVELHTLDEGTRNAVILAVAQTLVEAKVDVKLVLEYRVDPNRLARHLCENWPKAAKELGEFEALYKRLLEQTTVAIATRVAKLAGFDSALPRILLNDHERLLEILLKLYAKEEEQIVRFEADYRKSIQLVLDEFDLFGVREVQRLSDEQSLNAAFITLNATMIMSQEPSTYDNNETSKVYSASVTSDNFNSGDTRSQVQQRLGPIDQILSNASRFVIQGRAGSGKSTILRWLAIRIACQQCSAPLADWNDAIPFYIRLRQHVDDGFPALDEFVEIVGDHLDRDLPDGWVTSQLDSGRAVVLLDGIDELPKQKRNDFLRGLRRLVARYPYTRYIATSRPEATKGDQWQDWQDWLEQERFVVTTLQDMTLDQIDNFIQKWHKAFRADATRRTERELTMLSQRLQHLVRTRSELRSLAVNPLLCAMLCALHITQRDAVPTRRLQLYRECVNMLLEQRDIARKVLQDEELPQIDREHKMFLLNDFALWMLREGYSDVTVQGVDDYLEARLQEYRVPSLNNVEATGAGIRQVLTGRAGLLQELDEGRISFGHRTFQHFFAAQRIVDTSAINEALMRAEDDQWREPVILMIGMANEAERRYILQQLLSFGNRTWNIQIQRHYYLLSLACLETATALPRELHKAIMDKAVVLIPPINEDERSMIAKAGDSAISLLRFNPQHDYLSMCSCVWTLALIGGKAAMYAIADYANSDAYTKEEAFDLRNSIGHAWFSFDRQVYKEDVLSKLTILDLSDTSINDLNELKGLQNLQQLNLARVEANDVQPLTSLSYLQSVDLNGIPVSDVSSLAALRNLQELDLSATKIQNVEQLAGMNNLQKLSLRYTQVNDVRPLASLVNLRVLHLGLTSVNDISPLAPLHNLRELYLNVTQVSSADQFTGMNSLQKLDLRGTPISDLTPLASLSNLQVLDIDGCQSIELSTLAGLNHLRELQIGDLPVGDLSPLASLINLQRLSIWRVPVNDLSPLANLSNLKELVIFQSQVSDLRPLARLINLQKLSIYRSPVDSLTSLTGLKCLQYLILSETQVSDLSPLAGLSNLQRLEIQNTQVSDLSPLAGLSNLQVLAINGTQVRDLTPLVGLSKLAIW